MKHISEPPSELIFFDSLRLSQAAIDARKGGAQDLADALEGLTGVALRLQSVGGGPPLSSFRVGLPSLVNETSAPRVTFAILAQNSAKSIGRCVSSLPLDADILLIDTGSSDDTVELAMRERPELTVCTIPWGDDFGAARNSAFDIVRDSWVLFVDSDEWLSRDACEWVVGAIRALDTCPGAQTFGVALNLRDSTRPEAAMIGRGMHTSSTVRFVGRVHERLVDVQTNKTPYVVGFTPVVFHDGYEGAQASGKPERNSRLLDISATDAPLDLIQKFYRARDANIQDATREARFSEVAGGVASEWSGVHGSPVTNARRRVLQSLAERGEIGKALELVSSWGTIDPQGSDEISFESGMLWFENAVANCLQAAKALSRHLSANAGLDTENVAWAALLKSLFILERFDHLSGVLSSDFSGNAGRSFTRSVIDLLAAIAGPTSVEPPT